jgi:hypothetical protein
VEYRTDPAVFYPLGYPVAGGAPRLIGCRIGSTSVYLARKQGDFLMAPRNRRPQLEVLDGRLALSAGGTAALGVVKPHHVALNGEVSGRFLLAPGNPDVGSYQTLTGSGTVSPLGQVSASGTIKSPGFIARGRTTGTLDLSNANGSVTIRLTGPLKPGFATLPRKFTFKIVAATGQYVGDVDTGTATLDEVEADGIPTPSTSKSTVIVGPIFGLTLRSSPSTSGVSSGQA